MLQGFQSAMILSMNTKVLFFSLIDKSSIKYNQQISWNEKLVVQSVSKRWTHFHDGNNYTKICKQFNELPSLSELFINALSSLYLLHGQHQDDS